MASPREVLPMRRANVTQKVRVDGQSVHYTIGLYPDGRPGELFIDIARHGAALRTWVGETAMLFSVALQHGTPLETLVGLFVGSRCEPCGPVECHKRIRRCTSVMDLVVRSMAIDFLGREDLADLAIEVPVSVVMAPVVVESPSVISGFDYQPDRHRAGRITERVPNAGESH